MAELDDLRAEVERAGALLSFEHKRANRAEAKVAAVEALADELETFAKDGELNNGIAYGWRQGVQIAAHNLRERLASVGRTEHNGCTCEGCRATPGGMRTLLGRTDAEASPSATPETSLGGPAPEALPPCVKCGKQVGQTSGRVWCPSCGASQPTTPPPPEAGGE